MQARLEEAKRAALEAERRATKEAAERLTSETSTRVVARVAQEDVGLQMNANAGTSSKVLWAAESNLNFEQARLHKFKEVDERNQALRLTYNKDLSSYEKLIKRSINQIRRSTKVVRFSPIVSALIMTLLHVHMSLFLLPHRIDSLSVLPASFGPQDAFKIMSLCPSVQLAIKSNKALIFGESYVFSNGFVKVETLMDAFREVVEESGLLLKKLDKKLERTLLHSYRKDLTSQVSAETDPVSLLAKVVSLLYIQVHHKALQAPGRAISVAVSRLKDKLDDSAYKILTNYQTATVTLLALISICNW
nr:e3 ufm1-protein ligase 1 like [Quercus suber]